MKQLGYGRGYRYPPTEEADDQTYLPEELRGQRYYEPSAAGFEQEIGRRVDATRRRRDEPAPSEGSPGKHSAGDESPGAESKGEHSPGEHSAGEHSASDESER
jgi:putative ATPase